MKKYCLMALSDFLERGIVKLKRNKKDMIIFDYSNLITTVSPLKDKTFFRLYIGEGCTMQSCIKDVIQFKKDGNLLTYNINEIIDIFKIDVTNIK